MTITTLAALACLLAPVAHARSAPRAAPERDGAGITWNGRRYTPETLPDEVGAGPRSAMEFWRPWAEEHGYRMALHDDGRVLLLHSERDRADDSMRLIAKTCAAVDAAAPPAAPRPAVSERPADPPVATDPGVEPGGFTWSWEDTGPPLGTQTCVVLELRENDEYEAALELLAAHYDYLKPWIDSVRGKSGFVLERPLCAAFLSRGPGSEEWDPANELVNRTAQLLFLREYGRQPWWLAMGLAWYVEDDVRGSLYSFPYRDGFVGVTEHGGWDKALKRTYKKREAVAMDELAGWRRGAFDDEHARCAYGAAVFLARHHAEDLPAVLEELHATILREGRVTHPDGTWELIPDYEPPADSQREIVAKHLGPQWLDELLESFQKGRAYRP
jgi:hypothetical protein